jgi:hypothetical protein
LVVLVKVLVLLVLPVELVLWEAVVAPIFT